MSHRLTNALGAVAGFGAGASALLLIFVLWQTYTTAELIRGCLSPTGSCAQRAAERNAELTRVSERNHRQTRQTIRLAVACADQPGTQTTRQIAACVERKQR